MAGAGGGPGTDYRDRYSPRVRRRVKGKQVKVLCDLVTVSPEHMTRLRAVTDENREGGEKCLKSQSEYMPISNQIRSQVMAFG